MTVMVVVIICLLNHYRLSAWAFLTRHSQARRREEGMQPVSVRLQMFSSRCERPLTCVHMRLRTGLVCAICVSSKAEWV